MLNNKYYKKEKKINLEEDKKEQIIDKSFVNFENQKLKQPESMQNLDEKTHKIKDFLSENKSLIEISEYNNQENNRTSSKINDKTKNKFQTVNRKKNSIIILNESDDVNDNLKSK